MGVIETNERKMGVGNENPFTPVGDKK